MQKHILNLLLLCSIIAPGQILVGSCSSSCSTCCDSCYCNCNTCGCNPCCCGCNDYSNYCCCDEFESSVNEYGFVARVSNEVTDNADLCVEIADGRYLHILLPERLKKEQKKVIAKKVQDNVTVAIGDLFLIMFKNGNSKSLKNGVLCIKDKSGQIVPPFQVLIKDKEGCVGTAKLCCLDSIQLKVVGRRVKGVDNDNIGFIIPEELSEKFSKKQIDGLFYTFVNKKFSETVKYLEDSGLDVKRIILAEIMGN